MKYAVERDDGAEVHALIGEPLELSRAMQCAEALSGIPDEQLGEVKKAWLAWKLVDWMVELDIYEPPFKPQEPIDYALDFRKHGHDFGELNALIDSLK